MKAGLWKRRLNDHDELRHDPLMAVLADKLAARREDCAPVAGKSTLNLELTKLEPTRYHRSAASGGDQEPAGRPVGGGARAGLPSRSSSISMRRMIRCTASRRGGRTVAHTFALRCTLGLGAGVTNLPGRAPSSTCGRPFHVTATCHASARPRQPAPSAASVGHRAQPQRRAR